MLIFKILIASMVRIQLLNSYYIRLFDSLVLFVPVFASIPVHKKVQRVDQALCVVMHEIISPSVSTMEKATK